MATAEKVAAAHYRRQVALARRASAEAGRLWSQVDRADIARSWLGLVVQLLTVVSSAQALAAASSETYLDDVLDAQDIDPTAAGRLRPGALAGIASDGRELATLLYQPALRALGALAQGATLPRALAGGRLELDMIVRTQVADAGRVADGVALTARRGASGYVRMLNPPSCSRCVLLAGRFYEWNAGFARHPRCDCRHIPSSESRSDDLRTNPLEYFRSLSPAEQDRAFTITGARAIRDGADLNQVVNARRGARGLTTAGAHITAAEARMLRGGRDRGHLETVRIFGRDLYVTTEGITTRGLAGVRLGAKGAGRKGKGDRYRSAKGVRLMPESIYQIAGNDRDEAIRLLRRFGYII